MVPHERWTTPFFWFKISNNRQKKFYDTKIVHKEVRKNEIDLSFRKSLDFLNIKMCFFCHFSTFY